MENYSFSFASKEKNFLVSQGVNRGYHISYSKVNNCLFLSPSAKALYEIISAMSYGNSVCKVRSSYLRIALACSKNSLTKYLKELEELGFISKHVVGKGDTRNVVYMLEELHLVPALHHSEFIYTLLFDRDDEGLDFFVKRLDEYRGSSLCAKILKGNTKFDEETIAKIKDFFKEEIDEKKSIVNVVPIIPDMGRESEKKVKKSWDYNKVIIDDWNTNHFCSYFEGKYFSKYNSKYLTTIKDRSIIKNFVARKKNHAEVRELIDLYFDMSMFEARSIGHFVSSFVQGSMDYYRVSGKEPSIGKAKKPSKPNDTAWTAQLKDFDF